MLILAVDSSEDMGSVALAQDDRLLADYQFYTKMSLLQRLVPDIDHVLSDAGHKIGALDGIAVALGPGSFTGLRIGVTTAKTLAQSLGKPIVGIPTLDVLARGAAPTGAETICAMVHARAGEAYWALYDSMGDERVTHPAVGPVREAMEAAERRGGSVYFCGTGAVRSAEEIRHRFGSGALVCNHWAAYAKGAALLELASRRFREGLLDDPIALTPLYIRKPTPVVRLETGEFEKQNHPPAGKAQSPKSPVE